MTKRIIDILAIYFANKPVSKVYEYGSKSKGKGPAASDIDLLLDGSNSPGSDKNFEDEK